MHLKKLTMEVKKKSSMDKYNSHVKELPACNVRLRVNKSMYIFTHSLLFLFLFSIHFSNKKKIGGTKDKCIFLRNARGIKVLVITVLENI